MKRRAGIFCPFFILPFFSSFITINPSSTQIVGVGSKGRRCPLALRQFLFCCLLLIFLQEIQAFTGTYGVNYGRIADNLIGPESVVTLLKAAKIKNVRIFDADHGVLTAFKGSGLEISVMVPNELLTEMSTNQDKAMEWIKENVEPFLPETHIRGIAMGNEILGGANPELHEVLLGAVKNIYGSLQMLKLDDLIEVSTPHSQAVFANSYPPSSCTFRDNIVQYMIPLLDFFSKTGAPFYVNVYPFLAYDSDPEHIDIRYALFEKNPGIYDQKSNLHYDNMFDAQLDAAYAALVAAGYGKMEVRVSETGWASHGGENEAAATVANAKTYNYNLKKKLAKKKGTPFRPKIVVKAYVFALFNEDLKPGQLSERNFGLFKADGSISYDIGLSGLSSSAAASPLKAKDLKGLRYIMAVASSIATIIMMLGT